MFHTALLASIIPRTPVRGLRLSIENGTEQVNAGIAGRQGFWSLVTLKLVV